MKAVFIIFAMLALFGCDATVEIVGNGDLKTQSGTYDCPKSAAPCDFHTNTALNEVLWGVAHTGYQFVGYENCPELVFPYCYINVSGQTVYDLRNVDLPPLKVLFAKNDAMRVEVDSCTVGKGMDAAHCTDVFGQSIVGTDFHIEVDGSSFLAVGWNNRVYEGQIYGNQFIGFADGEQLVATLNGGAIRIVSWPIDRTGCVWQTFYCTVSIETTVR